jgi:hypothetical protein
MAPGGLGESHPVDTKAPYYGRCVATKQHFGQIRETHHFPRF